MNLLPYLLASPQRNILGSTKPAPSHRNDPLAREFRGSRRKQPSIETRAWAARGGPRHARLCDPHHAALAGEQRCFSRAVGRACLDRRRLVNDLAELDDSARRRVTCAGIGDRRKSLAMRMFERTKLCRICDMDWASPMSPNLSAAERFFRHSHSSDILPFCVSTCYRRTR